MNTNLVFQAIQFLMFYVVAAPLAVFALRAASNKFANSTMVYRWNDEADTPRWESFLPAAKIDLFGWSWERGFGPGWVRDNNGEHAPVLVVATMQFNRSDEHLEERFLVDKTYFLLVGPASAVPTWVGVIDAVGFVIIVLALILNANPIFRNSTSKMTATATRVVSTATILSTRTPTTTVTPKIVSDCGLRNVDLVLTALPAGGRWMRFSSVPQGSVGPEECPIFKSADQIALWDWVSKKWLMLAPTNNLTQGNYWILNTKEPLFHVELSAENGTSSIILPLEKIEMRDGKLVYKGIEYRVPFATFYKEQ
ncbi:MAG: hypothetical protein Q8L37_00280 [Candidatus Gottesmanbacteria bacterium]|nr:hypothetical protein [Candidatus Gottesmanbacteria bacterium]